MAAAEKKIITEDRSNRGRPRSQDKYLSILDAAADRFLTSGFDRTSMDEVARQAGVSKQTVYSHFQNKDRLFVEVIRQKLDEYFHVEEFDVEKGLPIREVLERIGRQVLSLIMSQDAMAMQRLMSGGGQDAEHVKMAQLFYEAGPREVQTQIARVLEKAVKRGQVQLTDSTKAAQRLLALLRGDLYYRACMGLETDPSAEAIEEHARDCADLFLRLYGVNGTAESPSR